MGSKMTILRVAALFASALGPASAAHGFSGGFIENRGQVNDAVRYYSPGSDAAIYFTPQAVVIDLKEHVARRLDEPAMGKRPFDPLAADSTSAPGTRRGCAVHIRFDGGNPLPSITVRNRLETQYNFFLGKDPSRWRSQVPAYAELVYHDVWPGVDLVFREAEGALAYEAVLHPGADAGQVSFRCEGAEVVHAEGAGNERLETAVGALDRTGSPLIGEFRHSGTQGRDSPEPDPGPLDNPNALLWSTFLGGSEIDHDRGLVLDASGDVVVTGVTCSCDFPATPGAYETSFKGGNGDAFVAKISSTGSTLLWSTFLGGCGFDTGTALALDDSGNAVTTGSTWSCDFPTTSGAYDTSYNDCDVFVAKISSTGSALLWSTFLGGCNYETGEELAVDAGGNVVVTGETGSSDFPTTAGAYDTSFNGGHYDAFVAKMSSTGSELLWSTFLGGSGDRDSGWAIALDAWGNAVVVGEASFPDFPTTPGAYDTLFDGGYCDVFVAKFSSSGSALLWCTFLGGTYYDEGRALALDSWGNAVVTGGTISPDFPTTPGAHDRSLDGSSDVFVAKVSSTGSALLWSTYLGGKSSDTGTALALDSSGNAVVTGGTSSSGFPTTPDAYDRSQNGGSDVFVAKVSSTGSALLWSTFLGGTCDDDGQYDSGLALDHSGNAVLMSWTASPDFPTTAGAYDRSFTGCYDPFVAKLRPQRLPVAEYLPLGGHDIRPAPPVGSWGSAFRFAGPPAAPITVRIFDVRGRLIRSLSGNGAAAGAPETVWDGKDEAGVLATPGIYFYQVAIGGLTRAGKIVIAR